MNEGMCEQLEHKDNYFFACKECYKDREKHLGCSVCNNKDEFCTICIKPVNKEKLKQFILSKIFLTKEESLNLREKELESEKQAFSGMKKINSELMQKISNLENEIGAIFREFERLNPIDGQAKEYFEHLWTYLCKELPKKLESQTLNKKIAEKKRQTQIKIYKRKLKELTGNSAKEDGGERK